MKIKKNTLIIIILSICFLIIGLVVRFSTLKEDSTIKSNDTCHTSSYYLLNYSYEEEKEKTIFLTNEKDYDKETRFSTDDKKKLDFEKYDYLVYFLDAQGGCDRKQRLTCVEYNAKGIVLNFEYFDIDESCDAIYYDAFIIELEKGKYDENINVEEKKYEVQNEEE